LEVCKNALKTIKIADMKAKITRNKGSLCNIHT